MPATTISFPKLHPTQKQIAEHPARFRILAAGRRWGKSRLGSALVVAEGLKGHRAWWVAPTYKMAQVGWRMIRRLSAPVPNVEIRRADRQVLFPGGGEVQVRSADEPDSLRGEGLNLAVLDECAFMLEEAWTEALRPALSDRKGKAVFISTPKRRNWFFTLWSRGHDGGEYQSWQLPTRDNPYIDPTEILAAQNELPTDIFNQEYEAAFLEGEGQVFRNLLACMGAPITTPEAHQGHRIIAGLDWGKQNDFTATSIGCADCRVEIARDRFNQIDYHFQYKRIAELWRAWGVLSAMVELNSIGEPGFEALQREGLPVVGFEMTATSKPPLIENLALIFERAEWQFQQDRVWTAELEAFERKVNLVTNRSTYSAPEGLHDDTVIARALMARSTNDWWFT